MLNLGLEGPTIKLPCCAIYLCLPPWPKILTRAVKPDFSISTGGVLFLSAKIESAFLLFLVFQPCSGGQLLRLHSSNAIAHPALQHQSAAQTDDLGIVSYVSQHPSNREAGYSNVPIQLQLFPKSETPGGQSWGQQHPPVDLNASQFDITPVFYRQIVVQSSACT